MRRSALPHALGTLALLLSLASCGGGGESAGQDNAGALASLDTRLTNGTAEPKAAPVGKPIAGPAAAPVTAPAPVTETAQAATPGATVDADGAAVRAAHAAIMTATPSQPARGTDAAAHSDSAGAARSLAAAVGKAVGGCAGRDLRHGAQWASAMPDGLGLYPGARLVEAAGTDTGRCALRVISFTTADSPQAVATHYATRVGEAGFDAERQPCRTEIRLGGTRRGDDAAYMLFARRTAKGLTEVDIVASAGPTA
ncbi:hypothetical protein LWE61_18945 [Sphingobium sufflavum]|uniref:hypothetical protein n=1 Tax=Sphingobium sufflavum TaxID=1129547 RepID=UPI001F41B1C4|nr:hypothetical protein [Sphingobium sufflavum]MCE7798612.1 hypothetical protein [Sphingobium sufflavum]